MTTSNHFLTLRKAYADKLVQEEQEGKRETAVSKARQKLISFNCRNTASVTRQQNRGFAKLLK